MNTCIRVLVSELILFIHNVPYYSTQLPIGTVLLNLNDEANMYEHFCTCDVSGVSITEFRWTLYVVSRD